MTNTQKNAILVTVSLIFISSIIFLLKLQNDTNKQLIELTEKISNNEKDINSINEKNKDFVERLAAYLSEIEKKDGTVNLTSESLQDIGKGFTVGKIELKQHLTGVKISGVVINSTSLDHSSATFKIKISNSVQSFTVNTIRAGASAQFSAYIPDIKLEDTNSGNISYTTSMVSYKPF